MYSVKDKVYLNQLQQLQLYRVTLNMYLAKFDGANL